MKQARQLVTHGQICIGDQKSRFHPTLSVGTKRLNCATTQTPHSTTQITRFARPSRVFETVQNTAKTKSILKQRREFAEEVREAGEASTVCLP